MVMPASSQTVAHATYSNVTRTVGASVEDAATRPGSRIRVRIAEDSIAIALRSCARVAREGHPSLGIFLRRRLIRSSLATSLAAERHRRLPGGGARRLSAPKLGRRYDPYDVPLVHLLADPPRHPTARAVRIEDVEFALLRDDQCAATLGLVLGTRRARESQRSEEAHGGSGRADERAPPKQIAPAQSPVDEGRLEPRERRPVFLHDILPAWPLSRAGSGMNEACTGGVTLSRTRLLRTTHQQKTCNCPWRSTFPARSEGYRSRLFHTITQRSLTEAVLSSKHESNVGAVSRIGEEDLFHVICRNPKPDSDGEEIDDLGGVGSEKMRSKDTAGAFLDEDLESGRRLAHPAAVEPAGSVLPARAGLQAGDARSVLREACRRPRPGGGDSPRPR